MPLAPPPLTGLAVLLTFPVTVALAQSHTATTAAEIVTPVLELTAVEVSASRVRASAIEGPQSIENYHSADIDASGAFTLDDFFDTLPPGAEGDEQLVLIDGQPAYIDPAMLALGMIEAIEVSLEGTMPELGARANGRVINIRLKKDYSGRTLGGRTSFSFAGGGARHNARFSASELHGKLRVMVSLEHNRSEALRAVDRPFSASQNRRAQGGSDLRLEWGHPAVVEAVDGQLDALSLSTGAPVAAALVPDGATATPDPLAFSPADPTLSAGAQGQRRFDTAAFRQLSSPAQNTGGSFTFSYDFNPRLNLALSASHRESTSQREDPPPVTPTSVGAIVPAAYSPFGEAVAIGLVHAGFGPTIETRAGGNTDAGLRLNGRIGETWRWNLGYGFRANRSHEHAIDLDEDAFIAAVAAPDPAARFNPFVDLTALPVAGLYNELTLTRDRRQLARSHRLDLRAHGEAFTAPGGPVRLSFQARASANQSERRTQSSDAPDTAIATHRRRGHSLSGSVSIPFVERQHAGPGLRRLELELSGDYEHENSGADEQQFQAGAVWSPARSLSLRVRHSVETENNRIVRDLRSDSLTGETFLDPRRDSSAVSGVGILVRELTATAPEQARRTQIGLTFEPEFLPGLRLSANYADRRRDPLFEDEFDAQDLINNETAFPGRVLRDVPTPEDLALGRPGRILLVDTTGGDAGAALSRDLNFSLDYRLPEQPYGRLHLKLDARHVIESRYEIRPGVAFVNEGGSRFNPPDWRIGGHVSWSHDGWTASLRGNHTGSVTMAIIDDDLPPYTEFEFNLGYRWQEPLWGDFGRGTRLMANIDNLFDRDPPFADTLNGYRGGSPLGRALSLSLEVPL